MRRAFAIMTTAAAVLVAGCASKGFVREEVDASESRTAEQIEAVEGQVEANQTRIAEQQAQLDSLSQTSREAGSIQRSSPSAPLPTSSTSRRSSPGEDVAPGS